VVTLDSTGNLRKNTWIQGSFCECPPPSSWLPWVCTSLFPKQLRQLINSLYTCTAHCMFKNLCLTISKYKCIVNSNYYFSKSIDIDTWVSRNWVILKFVLSLKSRFVKSRFGLSSLYLHSFSNYIILERHLNILWKMSQTKQSWYLTEYRYRPPYCTYRSKSWVDWFWIFF
jgi:hypothetical protein